MTGYTRADTADNIANGKAASADDLDAEFNAIQAAFNASTGHVHDGSTANGAPITKVGPTQDVVVSATTVLPKTDNTVDLGSTTLEFKDLWIDGTANIDSLVADTADINGGTIDATVVGATTPAAGSFTTVAASGGVTGNVSGNITSTGTSTFTTVDINGGAVDATVIGATTPAAATFTTVAATSVSAALTSSSVTFTSGTINGTSIGATTPSTGSFTTLAASGGITGNLTGNVTGALTGNASTATKLATARDIALSGDVVGTVSFDGSANATITTTIQANSVALGTDTTGDYVAGIGGTTNQITVTSSGGEGSTPTLSLPSAVVLPGSLQTTTDVIVGGNLTVNGTTTTVNSNTVNIGDNTIVLNSDETGTPSQDAGIEIERGTSANVSWLWDETNDRWTAGTQSIYAGGGFTGNLTGAVTGNVSGNAGTATKLATARTLSLSGDATGSVSFDGSANADIVVAVADNSHAHTIANVTGLQTALDAKQPLDATLTAVAAYNTNGLLTQTAADTFTGRALVAGTGISITNGDGVAGNPTITNTLTVEATVLLGTLATTSGTSVTLSSLVLTDYKFLKVVFRAISTNSTMSNLRIAGELCSDDLSDTSWFFNGIAEIDLGTGVWTSSIVQTNGADSSGASSTYVGTSGYSTATTSVVFSIDTGSFDAGSILVYGVK